MKIAIIGAGVSGLVTAWKLFREHQVTVFESGGYPGGHTNTVDVDWDGKEYSVDTGFIVFNDRTYPNFIRLLDELQVASRPTTMSFSVRDEDSGLEYNGHSLDTLFAQRANLLRPGFYRMLADIVRFNREAPKLLASGDDELTVGQYLQQNKYGRRFVEHYLLPMGAAIWSCPTGTFAEFPVRFIVDFYRNHGLLSVRNRPTWRVVEGGSRSYVQAMIRGFQDRIRLNARVENIQRTDFHVRLTTANGQMETFDHVVLACHSDQALKILGCGATPTERQVLGAFPYSRNVAVLHTDQSILPRSRRAWASWNYLLKNDTLAPASVTYNMNILQGIQSKNTFCVTLNDESRIAPDRVLRKFEYHHPVFTTGRARAQSRHQELLIRNRTSFCGAYWGNGFHEDGVNSALAVVKALKQPSAGRQLEIATAGGAGS